MKAEIINVVTDFPMGDIVNTNFQYLSEKLVELGIDLYWHIIVGHNKEAIKQILEQSSKRSDVMFFIGGLSHTGDDLIKEALSEVLNKNLKLNENPLNNIKQTYIPNGATIIPNDIGSASGMYIKENIF